MEWRVNITGPKCPNTHILHLIKTAPRNDHMRKLIRTYFTEMKSRSDEKLDILFIVGNSKDSEIEAERSEFNDFIIGDFTDSYTNLPWKE